MYLWWSLSENHPLMLLSVASPQAVHLLLILSTSKLFPVTLYKTHTSIDKVVIGLDDTMCARLQSVLPVVGMLLCCTIDHFILLP